MDNQRLCVKQLADALQRSAGYVYAMRRDGFFMPGGTSTLKEALDWLTAHPEFRKDKKRGVKF